MHIFCVFIELTKMFLIKCPPLAVCLNKYSLGQKFLLKCDRGPYRNIFPIYLNRLMKIIIYISENIQIIVLFLKFMKIPSSQVIIRDILENVSGSTVFGDRCTSKRDSTVAIAALLCISAKRMPGHMRGPSPKPRNAHLCLSDLAKSVKRSGSNRNGSSKISGSRCSE